jgi:hypothetical protein
MNLGRPPTLSPLQSPMKTAAKIVFALAFGATSLWAQTAPAAPAAPVKNWTAPTYKIQGQVLCDQIMAQHPELISVTLHGVPPGLSKVYTMFAGSFPERIGNPDDPDDVMIVELGITIIDPRWHRTKDAVKKFVMMLPLRDAAGENCGSIILAYKNDAPRGKTEKDFYLASTALRDGLQKQIPSYEGLFASAK